ncbi:hypothetical protein ABW636_13560 [Aquimarina sp. 2201CG1-2-11]|uniref:hypothetical protein n=1 Tax=Aquimarina discodermiae TaxID=3231043 RepID=UPI003461C167
MRKILLLSIAVLIVSCSQGPNASKPFMYSKNTIKFQNNTLTLTSSYVKTTRDEFVKELDLLDETSKFKKIALDELKKVESKNVDYEIFVDQNNVENYVFIYVCDFYLLSEHRAAKVVSAMNRQLERESNKQEVRYKRIHGRFFFTPDSKVVKLKYLKAYKSQRKFQTEYIVASKKGGIGLLISNLNDIDFENSIKRLASN